MIIRRTFHFEWHRSYWPRLSFRRIRGVGELVLNDDILCVLKRCPTCDEGFLAVELEPRIDRHRHRPMRAVK